MFSVTGNVTVTAGRTTVITNAENPVLYLRWLLPTQANDN
jgi:hypothetical protein